MQKVRPTSSSSGKTFSARKFDRSSLFNASGDVFHARSSTTSCHCNGSGRFHTNKARPTRHCNERERRFAHKKVRGLVLNESVSKHVFTKKVRSTNPVTSEKTL
ncbi:hypothetical protein AVEN_188644-1 [Araneus ventricosus]|uniref:Uncharacterized protein n=1 Tax=Araneus ventricosus TaxID=182803 RepID=A0A4Y2RYK3_ARAVE|nr:hypothetical protein AVEN_188644-1 [Araneus ventricosus]